MSHRHNRRPRRGPTQFPGIGRDAVALGVTRKRLWLTLTGREVSKSIAARYAALKAAQITESKKT